MELTPYSVWNVILTLVYAPLVYGIRQNSQELKRVDILLNKTRRKCSKTIIQKLITSCDMDRLLSRFDKLEEKIDQILNG